MEAACPIPQAIAYLLFYSENRVLCHFGNSEFQHGFGWNPNLLSRLGIKARACFSPVLILEEPG